MSGRVAFELNVPPSLYLFFVSDIRSSSRERECARIWLFGGKDFS